MLLHTLLDRSNYECTFFKRNNFHLIHKINIQFHLKNFKSFKLFIVRSENIKKNIFVFAVVIGETKLYKINTESLTKRCYECIQFKNRKQLLALN